MGVARATGQQAWIRASQLINQYLQSHHQSAFITTVITHEMIQINRKNRSIINFDKSGS